MGLIIYGSLDTMSGGYLYDRRLVDYLREQGDHVEIISLPWRSYLSHLTDNLHFHLPSGLDILIEDELNHPSLLIANAQSHPYPIVSLVHNLHSSEKRPAWQNTFYRALERQYLRTVDGFIFNSQTTRRAVNLLVEGTPSSDRPNIVATPGGDRLGSLTSESVRARAIQPGPLRLLFLANVIPLKGLHILLDAVRLQTLDIRLDIVGSLTVNPLYAQEMKQQVIAHGLQSKVFFHGILDDEALAGILRQAHVLVIPSFYEGFGIAYLEGMAFGLPAIGTRAGAIPQLVIDKENGFLINPGDSEALTKCLQALRVDQELLIRLSMNALRYFQSQPTWAQAMESIRNFLLSNTGARRSQST